MILNGSAPPATRTGGTALAWRPADRPRAARPFFDPRWRFAARAVCRLWRETIEQPTAGEADVLYRWRAKTQHWPSIDARRVHSARCPRWATGRLVCASAVAEWVAAGTGPWGQQRDAVQAWCRDNAGASHKQVIAALVASDADWAVERALGVEWAAAHFSVGDRCVLAAHMGSGEYDYWDDDARGDEHGLEDMLWRVAIRWGSHSTLLAVAARRSPPGYERATTHDALGRACRAGRARLVAKLLEDGACVDNKAWSCAARARDVGCFEALLDCAPPLCDGRAPLPPPTVPDEKGEHVPVYGQWFHEAISAGRWRVLALCDARGIEFDAAAAFMLAARARRTKVLSWLWARMHADHGRALKSDRATHERPAQWNIDLPQAARCAVGHHNRRRARSADTIAWLCEVAAYVPETQDELTHLIVRACASHCVPCALYLVERWPRRALTIGTAALGVLFRACLCDGIAAVGRFLGVVHKHGHDLGADAVERIDLWGALASPLPTSSSSSSTRGLVHYGANHRRWVSGPCTAAAMRIAHDLANGRPIRAADVAQIDTMPRILGAPLCACTRDQTREDGSAFDTKGDTQQQHAGATAALHATKCDSVADGDDPPCTDEAALASLGPLGIWCRPRPVVVDALFPGWRARAGLAPSGGLRALTHDALCRRTVLWLESVGLVLSTDGSAPAPALPDA
nr:ankyrin repeat [Pandoravirus massiliensis]